VVSVVVAEAAAEDSRAAGDAATAQMYAVNIVLLEDRGGIPGRTMAEVFEEYTADLLGEFGGSPDRSLAAARAVAARAAGSVGYPMLRRQVALAVELCQRAAEMAPSQRTPRSAPATTRGTLSWPVYGDFLV
jgi:hypothetical protein